MIVGLYREQWHSRNHHNKLKIKMNACIGRSHRLFTNAVERFCNTWHCDVALVRIAIPDVCARCERMPSRQPGVETKLDKEPVRILKTCCAGLERKQQLDRLKSLANLYRSTLTSTRTTTVLQNSTDLVHSHTRQQHRAHDGTMHKPSHEVR